ncbi:MAG TPA: hypothetical protein VMF66_15575 [Candidatus Acidoferrum sp.]|nr:hypothetical protein [Candidatus Acidoferrum sp.]
MTEGPRREIAEEVTGKRKSRSLSPGQTLAGFGMTISSYATAMEGGFGGEASGAGFTVEGVADAAQTDGPTKATVPAMPVRFLASAIELVESSGRKGSVTAPETDGVDGETFGKLVDPGMTDAKKTRDAKGGPFGSGRKPPLPDELLDDAGFESTAPGKRSTAARGASLLDVGEARLTSAG